MERHCFLSVALVSALINRIPSIIYINMNYNDSNNYLHPKHVVNLRDLSLEIVYRTYLQQ